MNLMTKEITNIVEAPCDIDSSLESESVLLYGKEYNVFTTEELTCKRLVDIEDSLVPY